MLLLDEPFSALDELTARRLRLLLQALWLNESQSRPTGILVTHNMMEAAFLADRIFVMGGHPARFSAVIEVNVRRPRDPDVELPRFRGHFSNEREESEMPHPSRPTRLSFDGRWSSWRSAGAA